MTIEIAGRDGVSEDQAESTLRGRLRSHFINDAAFVAMKTNDFDAFVAARADAFKEFIQSEFSVALTVVAAADEAEIADIVAESEENGAAA
jgi:hypothetical protein